MKVSFHPEFPKDIRRFEHDYAQISESLSMRFRRETDSAVDAIISEPTAAGHFLNLGSAIVPDFRRRNLRRFHSSFSTASWATN